MGFRIAVSPSIFIQSGCSAHYFEVQIELFPPVALLWVVDRVDDGVEAAGNLAHQAGDLRGKRRAHSLHTKLGQQGDPGVRRPAQQPQRNVGYGHLGDAELGARRRLVLIVVGGVVILLINWFVHFLPH